MCTVKQIVVYFYVFSQGLKSLVEDRAAAGKDSIQMSDDPSAGGGKRLQIDDLIIIPNNTDVPIERAKWVALCWSVITLYVKLASGSLPFWLFDMEKSSKSSKLLVLLPYSQDILFMDLVVLYVVIVYELSKK